MLNKDDIRHIIGSAILFDERHRFDDWKGDEAKEWVEQIASAIIGLLTPTASDPAYCSCEKPLPTREFRTCNQCGRRISPSARATEEQEYAAKRAEQGVQAKWIRNHVPVPVCI